MGKFISELTYPEAKAAIGKDTVVVLPIGGGSKEHGWQLPMGTDYYVTEYLARELTKMADVLTLPILPYAYFPAFVEWEGSVSVRYDHFMNYVRDILLSFQRFGVRKFLIIDFGVSTHMPLTILSRELKNECNITVAVSNCHGLGAEVSARLCRQKQGGHADESETSVMLHIKPELVHMEHAAEEYCAAFPFSRANGMEKIYVPATMNTPHGSNGNSTLANAESGKQIAGAMVQELFDFVQAFICWDPEQQPNGPQA